MSKLAILGSPKRLRLRGAHADRPNGRRGAPALLAPGTASPYRRRGETSPARCGFCRKRPNCTAKSRGGCPKLGSSKQELVRGQICR